MHLAYLDAMRDLAIKPSTRRTFLTASATAALAGSVLAGAEPTRGSKGEGAMGPSTGEDWIDTFFTGGAEAIIHYYADEFVFEDVTLFQTISDKESLYRAFLPFGDAGPDAPAGVHQFDVIRYDGGGSGTHRGAARGETPDNYSTDEWASWSSATLMGADYDYDEWAVMNWVWKAKHNMDFLGLPAKGKTTHTRGMTFHAYKNRRIVREFTYWNYRDVAIQLGAAQPQEKFWVTPSPGSGEGSR